MKRLQRVAIVSLLVSVVCVAGYLGITARMIYHIAASNEADVSLFGWHAATRLFMSAASVLLFVGIFLDRQANRRGHLEKSRARLVTLIVASAAFVLVNPVFGSVAVLFFFALKYFKRTWAVTAVCIVVGVLIVAMSPLGTKLIQKCYYALTWPPPEGDYGSGTSANSPDGLFAAQLDFSVERSRSPEHRYYELTVLRKDPDKQERPLVFYRRIDTSARHGGMLPHDMVRWSEDSSTVTFRLKSTNVKVHVSEPIGVEQSPAGDVLRAAPEE